MKSDLSRQTFDRARHYSAVLLQQGRVLLDADWNEQLAIAQHRIDTGTADLFGLTGAPLHEAGFQLTTDGVTLTIGAGRYYVDGILCQNEAAVGFEAQPDLPETELPTTAGAYLAYLDVWHHHITALDDPLILETALGGPDTATRLKTVCLVRLLPVQAAEAVTCGDPTPEWDALVQPGSGLLAARTQPTPIAETPCVIPPGAGYRGLENHLYRVEIHQEGPPGTATFKWSRDNGIAVTTIRTIRGEALSVDSVGPDDVLGFAGGQWTELFDDRSELREKAGEWVKVATVNTQTGEIQSTVAPLPLAANDNGVDPRYHPKLRRWDQNADGDTPDVLVMTDSWIELEEGIEVQFTGAYFKAGEYWLIPARTAFKDQAARIEWPANALAQPLVQPPHGPYHHYARLAVVERRDEAWIVQEDCRKLVAPLTDSVEIISVLGRDADNRPVYVRDGASVPVAVLANGLRVVLNQDLDPATLTSASCYVTLEVPIAIGTDPVSTYQPLVLAADLHASERGAVTWQPAPNTKAFLKSPQLGALTRRIRQSFQHEWDVLHPAGSAAPSIWDYDADSNLLQTGRAGVGDTSAFGLGTIALSKQRLRNDAQYIGLSAMRVSDAPSGRDVGLVFNWQSEADYWVYLCRGYSVSIGFSGGYDATGWVIMHVLNGHVAQSFSAEIAQNPMLSVSLDIKQTGDRLVFGGQIYRGGSFGATVAFGPLPVAAAAVPNRLDADAGIGVFTRYTTAYAFKRLLVVYPDAPEVLIPPTRPALARLTIKRNFLRPDPSGRAQAAVKSAPDFERWFWAMPVAGRDAYGYGYGYGDFLGIGPL